MNPLPEVYTLQGILKSVSICGKIFDGGNMMNRMYIDCLRNGFSIICPLTPYLVFIMTRLMCSLVVYYHDLQVDIKSEMFH